MLDPGEWTQRSKLIGHLAMQLLRGRLVLILGAGVSRQFGLPDWIKLVDTISKDHGYPAMTQSDDPTIRIQRIKNEKFKNEKSYLEAVQSILYSHSGLTKNDEIDFATLRSNDLLAAIAALVMASRRGSASTLVTFNFDDLLEIYLEFHGFVVASIGDKKHWSGGHDAVVYHPHGLLPLAKDRAWSEKIVFSASEFIDIMTDAENEWRSLLRTLFRTHTTLQIGLSGQDDHLKALMARVGETHAITHRDERVAFHSVRFSIAANRQPDLESAYRGWGVFTHELKEYSELPSFLFEICQQARKLRVAADQL